MTETMSAGAYNGPKPAGAGSGGPAAAIRLKQGRALFGNDLRIVDADGRDLPWNGSVAGELLVRGPRVCRRYYRAEQDAVDADRWFHTGDIATIDPSGFIQITDRAKDLIKSGGEWINPAEIEEIIGRIPGVSLAAVIGRAHPRWGERPLLLVEMRAADETIDASLLQALQGEVPPWWIPDEVIRVERMPLAATGKIDKMRLRAEFGGAQWRREA